MFKIEYLGNKQREGDRSKRKTGGISSLSVKFKNQFMDLTAY